MEEKKDKEYTKDKDISKEIVELVIARLETMPANVNLSIGDEGSFTVKDLIERVKAEDEIGKKVIELQLSYLRSLKDLPIEENVSVNN